MGSACLVLAAQILVAFLAVAVAHAIEAGQVGERLARAKHVVSADGGIDMRQIDLDDGCAGGLKLGSGLGHALRNLEGQPLGIHEAAHHADAHTRDILLACGAETGLHILRRAVQGVMTAQGVHRGGGVLDAAGERADLIERAAEGNHAVTADRAIGGLDAHDAAEAGGLADGAARVGAQRDARHARGDSRRRAARAAARDATQIPRVARGAERGGLGGGAERELVHVQLAQRHAAGIDNALHARCSVRRHVVFQHAGGAGGVRARHVHVVLERHRHTGQRAERIERAVADSLVNALRGGHGSLGGNL